MSNERVDVLGIIDGELHIVRRIMNRRRIESLESARAAVVELIDAATAMAGVQVNRRPALFNDSATAKKARLREVLSRIGGADDRTP